MAIQPIELLSLPQIHDETEDAEQLRRMLVHDIPAVLIKHSGVELNTAAALNVHQNNVDRVTHALQSLHPAKLVGSMILADFNGLGQNPIGLFHNDISLNLSVNPSTEPAVHTTLSGGGNVFFAQMGSQPSLVLKTPYMSAQNPHAKEREDPNHPHSLLLRELVDTRFTHPKIYSATLSPGDTVVMSDRGRYSAWHRYDTNTAMRHRTVRVTLLQDRTELPRRSSNYCNGFDLKTQL